MRPGVVAAGVLMMIIGGVFMFFIWGGVGAGAVSLGFLVFIAGLVAPPQKAPSPVVIVQQSARPKRKTKSREVEEKTKVPQTKVLN